MTRRITDLLDDYYDTSVPLPLESKPTAAETKARTLAKIQVRKRRRAPVGALVAACFALALGITAGAVGYTMRDAARTDAGISAEASVPEYVEYEPGEVENPEFVLAEKFADEYVEGANIELVSTLCSGNRVTAYVAVSPVTQEMAEDWDMDSLGELNIVPPQTDQLQGEQQFPWNYSYGLWKVDYDPETETVLTRLDFYGDDVEIATEFVIGLYWHGEVDGEEVKKNYGLVRIPITESNEVTFTPELVFSNDYLTGETAIINTVTVGASFIGFHYSVKPLEQLCEEYGEDAWFIIGDAYWGYYAEQAGRARDTEYDELDAQVAYHRSWEASLAALVQDGDLTLTDGTEISLAGLQLYDIENENNTDEWTYGYELPSALDLSQVASLTLGGNTYNVQ